MTGKGGGPGNPVWAADLSTRLIALRDVLDQRIEAVRREADARMDAMDAARQQYLAMLADQRAGTDKQISSVTKLQDVYHESQAAQLTERSREHSENLHAAAATLQLQLDQRFDTERQDFQVLRAQIAQRFESVHREYEALQLQLDQRLEVAAAARQASLENTRHDIKVMQEQIDKRFETEHRESATLQLQIDQRFGVEAGARQTALESATAAVRAALHSAETAVNKAEQAAEKRFDGVNEFRRTLTDQAASFPTRKEVDARTEALTATGARNADSIKDLELRLTSRLDTLTSRLGGRDTERSEHRLDTAQVLQLLALLVVAIGVVVSILLKKG